MPISYLASPYRARFPEYDFLHTVSIQNQLVADSLKYDLTLVELFYTPVPRPEGWMAVFFNMLTRVIWVIDPLYHNKLACPPTGQHDEIIAWKLHDALFTCLNEFYAGWPTSKDNWTLKFPSMTDCIFSCADTGGCVLLVARHFGAHKLKMPLTKLDVAIIDFETIVHATHMIQLPVDPPAKSGQCRCCMCANIDHNKKYLYMEFDSTDESRLEARQNT
ncbi:uncharacterized protein LOC119327670 isoform X2 [Triticum dicoccoides]|uniref:uncharacterized protein LOC119327670 isoform X2 n=1 Tax=Triticum dicoccoides TaxID=85692 RepID=UPI000E7A1672|nr:uncharacterized protein LOC119327670 isoform X2 [Triticum dicoccoides]